MVDQKAQASNSVALPNPFRPISASALNVLALMHAKKVVREQMRDEGRRITLVSPAELNAKARAYLAEHRAELYGEAIATAWAIAANDQRMSKWLFDDERRAKRARRSPVCD
jgi:hypothetical protein